MKKAFVITVVAVMLASMPAFAQYFAGQQWSSNVLATATQSNPVMNWMIPVFVMPQTERMTVKVIASGGNFAGASSGDLAGWIETNIIRQLASEAPKHNMKVFSGASRVGDLLFETEVRVVSGGEWNRFNSSSSDSYSSRHGSTSHSSASEHGNKAEGVYISVQPILYRMGTNGDKEILVATAARISASETTVVGGQESFAHSDSSSYSHRGHGRINSSSNSGSQSSNWGRDEQIERERMFDSLIQDLSRQAIALTFQELSQSLQAARYVQLKLAEPKMPPAATESAGKPEVTVTVR